MLDSTYMVIQSQHLFKPKILPQNIYLRTGQVYNQNRYIRTVDRFNSNVAWRLATVEQKPRPGTDTVDFYVRLVPARKYLFVANLEASRNQNPFLLPGKSIGNWSECDFTKQEFWKGGCTNKHNSPVWNRIEHFKGNAVS